MGCFDIKEFISSIKTVLPSNAHSIFKDLISFIVETKTYRDQNFGKAYEDIDSSTVSKILGHKDISVTARIYVHNEIAELRKAVRWCNRREPIQEEYIP